MFIYDEEGFRNDGRFYDVDSIRIRKYRMKFYNKRHGKDNLDYHWCLLIDGKIKR